MGSGLTQAYVATWGALLGEQILAADSDTIEISGLAPGFKYLRILCTLAGNPTAGVTTPWGMEVTSVLGAGVYDYIQSTEQNGDVLTCNSFFMAPNFNGGPLGISGEWWLSEWTLAVNPPAADRFQMIGSGMCAVYALWRIAGNVIMAPGETHISKITLYTWVLGDVFEAGSRVQVYGLN